ncbi:MAG: hypothetical protein B6245_23635 [Desulfobacteraceae bacterium 4572_88]|nr:MAG: hypothetical protein B6245_23635 [Desulfobacteraceae bacterium 4572_88]
MSEGQQIEAFGNLEPKFPFEGRAVKFFSEQRQFRFRVFRARDSVPCLSAALRETEYSLAETRRRGDRDAEFSYS